MWRSLRLWPQGQRCALLSRVCVCQWIDVSSSVCFYQRITALTGFVLECQEATVQSHPRHGPPRYSWILRYRRPLVSLKGHGLSPEMLCVWRWWWSLRIDCPFNQCCIEDIMNHILRTSDTHFKVGQMSFFFFCCCFFLWRHFTQTFIWRRAAPSSNAVVGPHVNTI